MSKETEKFLEKLGNNYFENLIPEIFGENHPRIKEFDDLKHAIKHGRISLKFIYKPQLAKEFLGNQNGGFYTGIRNIKNIGIIIYALYILIAFQDYKFLLVLPIMLVLNKILLFFWNKKLITTIILTLATLFFSSYFNLNNHYSIILISYIILQSITYSSYFNFFEEYFSKDEIVFDHALELKMITKIYDSYTKRTIKLNK